MFSLIKLTVTAHTFCIGLIQSPSPLIQLSWNNYLTKLLRLKNKTTLFYIPIFQNIFGESPIGLFYSLHSPGVSSIPGLINWPNQPCLGECNEVEEIIWGQRKGQVVVKWGNRAKWGWGCICIHNFIPQKDKLVEIQMNNGAMKQLPGPTYNLVKTNFDSRI